MRIITLNKESKEKLKEALASRSTGKMTDLEKKVEAIIDNVKANGDKAVFEYTKAFDGFDLNKDNIKVTDEEIKEAFDSLDPKFIQVIEDAAANIRKFHEKQKRISWIDTNEDGTLLGQKFTPIEIAGVYVPGGKAAYPSSVLMNIVTAKVAGVPRIVMCTPPNKEGKVNSGTLAAAKIAGVDEIYKVGGAQAIAAMAYGTESIPKHIRFVDLVTSLLHLPRRLSTER